MRFYCKPLITLALVFSATQAFAGAWTQKQGQGQLILTNTYYFASQRYDNTGREQRQPHYRKYELAPYLEYGYSDSTTLGGSFSLQRAAQNAGAGVSAQTNWGLGDSELFLRKRLWQQGGFVASVEPLIKLPSPASSGYDLPKLGGSHGDLALGLPAGYGFSAGGLNHFIALDTQYRYRLGSAKDQVKLSATAGFRITERWMLMPQTFLTYRTSAPERAVFTQSAGDDYNLARLQLSALYAFSQNLSLQFGGFNDVYGKNAGHGKGVLIALWKRI